MTAHELRSPIGVLSMSVELLRLRGAEIAGDDQDRVLAGMSVSATRLQQVRADLVTDSGIQAGALVPKPAVLPLLEELATPAGTAQLKVPGGDEIEVEVEADPGCVCSRTGSTCARSWRTSCSTPPGTGHPP